MQGAPPAPPEPPGHRQATTTAAAAVDAQPPAPTDAGEPPQGSPQQHDAASQPPVLEPPAGGEAVTEAAAAAEGEAVAEAAAAGEGAGAAGAAAAPGEGGQAPRAGPLHHLTRHYIPEAERGEAVLGRLGAPDIRTAEQLVRCARPESGEAGGMGCSAWSAAGPPARPARPHNRPPSGRVRLPQEHGPARASGRVSASVWIRHPGTQSSGSAGCAGSCLLARHCPVPKPCCCATHLHTAAAALPVHARRASTTPGCGAS